MIKDMIRWCSDLGMFATDRPINDVVNKDGKVIVEGTCIWKTSVSVSYTHLTLPTKA